MLLPVFAAELTSGSKSAVVRCFQLALSVCHQSETDSLVGPADLDLNVREARISRANPIKRVARWAHSHCHQSAGRRQAQLRAVAHGGITAHSMLPDSNETYRNGIISFTFPSWTLVNDADEGTNGPAVRQGAPLIHLDPTRLVLYRDHTKSRIDSEEGQTPSRDLGLETAEDNVSVVPHLARTDRLSAEVDLQLEQPCDLRQRDRSRQASTPPGIDSTSSCHQQAEAKVAQVRSHFIQGEPAAPNVGQSAIQVSRLQDRGERNVTHVGQAHPALASTVARVPQNGIVTQVEVEIGSDATTDNGGTPSVAPDTWALLHHKRTRLHDMHADQEADVDVDACSAPEMQGHVDTSQRAWVSKSRAFLVRRDAHTLVMIAVRAPVPMAIDPGSTPDEPLPPSVSLESTVPLG